MLTELIPHVCAGISFAWLIDNRLFKGRRKYNEMVKWFDETVKEIESETNYQRLVDIGKAIANRFQHYLRYMDYDLIRAHDKALTGLLNDRKQIVLNQYTN